MDDIDIIETLKKWNLWEHQVDSGIKRERYIKQIFPYLDRRETIVLKGIRRSGKSTLIKQLMQELVKKGTNKRQLIYLNLEDYNFANYLTVDLFENVLNSYKKYFKHKKKIYFFVDEVQKIQGWEKWIRTKYDQNENIKFIVTGSSASLLSKDFSTLLTGRNISFKILPLSYLEFLDFSKNKSFENYLQFGGFPEVVLEKSEDKKISLLQQYFEDIIHKDIIDRHRIRNAKQLINLARYLVSTSGSKISLNKLSRVFGISKDTISSYINYMIHAYMIFEVTYFSFSAKIRHDVSKLPKLYVVDNGFISTVTINYSSNTGQKFENAALIKLLENFEVISYWSELKSEVDFIVENTAINVTSTDNARKREIAGLEDFQHSHKDFNAILIAKSKSKDNIISMKDFLSDKIKL